MNNVHASDLILNSSLNYSSKGWAAGSTSVSEPQSPAGTSCLTSQSLSSHVDTPKSLSKWPPTTGPLKMSVAHQSFSELGCKQQPRKCIPQGVLSVDSSPPPAPAIISLTSLQDRQLRLAPFIRADKKQGIASLDTVMLGENCTICVFSLSHLLEWKRKSPLFGQSHLTH